MEDLKEKFNKINNMLVLNGGDNDFLFSNKKSFINVNAWLERFRDKETDKRMTIAVTPDEYEKARQILPEDRCLVVASEKLKAFFEYKEKDREAFLLKHYNEILFEALFQFEKSKNNMNFGNIFDLSYIHEFLLSKQLEKDE